MGRKLPNHLRNNPFEQVTNDYLLHKVKTVLGEIDLDPASSEKANEYVGAKHYFTAKDDPINSAKWYGRVYLFPPSHTYFWHKQTARWKVTRGLSKTLISGSALWWQTLKRKWINGEVKEAIYMSNQIDIVLYCQDIFDHPVCILNKRPKLDRIYPDGLIEEAVPTGTCVVVYLHDTSDISKVEEKTNLFIDTYSEAGRVII